MLLDDNFLATVQDDPVAAAIEACVRVQRQFGNDQEWSTDEYCSKVTPSSMFFSLKN
jgi:hypothetical protein